MASMQNPARFPLILYKRVLRLHYGLPTDMRVMGDSYVKSEFRLHRNAPPQQALIFLKQWTDYCTELSRQLSNKGIKRGDLGSDLNPALVQQFTDEQIIQLYELKVESEKWREKKQSLSEAS